MFTALRTLTFDAFEPIFDLRDIVADESNIGFEIFDSRFESAETSIVSVESSIDAIESSINGDPQRFKDTYWSKFEHLYLAGDGCHRDADGDFWFMGRIDDVMNVSGHRISTAEVESALVDHHAVAEAAVVGKTDDLTGQAIVCFVSLLSHAEPSAELHTELRNHVATKLGKFTMPKELTFTQELPKTRSGKIMRRLLRDIAEGRELGDTTTLADSSVVLDLQSRAQAAIGKDE